MKPVSAHDAAYMASAVQTLCERCKTPHDFLNVMRSLLNEQAVMWTIYDGAQPMAHMVTALQRDMLGVTSICVWKIAGHGASKWLVEAERLTTAYAKSVGATRLIMTTQRKGWARLLRWRETILMEKVIQ